MKHMIYNLTHKNKRVLKIDLIRHLFVDKFDERRSITEESEADLFAAGYLPAKGYVDSMEYFGVPVYMKLSNWYEYELQPEDPRDTSYTLNDFTHAQTVEKFKKGLTRASKISGMDAKMIGVIVVVIAVAAGFIFLFGNR